MIAVTEDALAPRTHNLVILLGTLQDAGESTAGLESLVDLNPFAVHHRYEFRASDGKDLDRAAALVEVEALYRRVGGRISAKG